MANFQFKMGSETAAGRQNANAAETRTHAAGSEPNDRKTRRTLAILVVPRRVREAGAFSTGRNDRIADLSKRPFFQINKMISEIAELQSAAATRSGKSASSANELEAAKAELKRATVAHTAEVGRLNAQAADLQRDLEAKSAALQSLRLDKSVGDVSLAAIAVQLVYPLGVATRRGSSSGNCAACRRGKKDTQRDGARRSAPQRRARRSSKDARRSARSSAARRKSASRRVGDSRDEPRRFDVKRCRRAPTTHGDAQKRR